MVRVLPTIPPELVVADHDEPCPYLEGQVARRPLRFPIRKLTRAELDARLEAGDRRNGFYLYDQHCPACRACEPLRVDALGFQPSSSQARAARKADRALLVEVGEPCVDDERLALFTKHEQGRGLSTRTEPIGAEEFTSFLVESSVPTFELRYRLRATGELIGVALTDRAERSLSAVYTYYDPAHAHLSPGIFSIVTQLRLCQAWGLPWLYLGLAVQGSDRMRYKLDWFPHERRLNGAWARFERPQVR